MGAVPADFIDKWKTYLYHFRTIDGYTVLIATITIAIVALWPKVTHKIPGSLIAILVTTALAQIGHLPIETIGSKFGHILLFAKTGHPSFGS